MSGVQTRTRRALRGLVLLAGLLALWAMLTALVGAPAELIDTIAGATELGADPVEVVLAALGLAAQALTAYLVVLVILAVAGQLPGLLGHLATRAFRTIGVPVIRRSLEAMLGGVLAVGLLAGPVAPMAAAAEQRGEAPVVQTVAAGVQSAAAATAAEGDTPVVKAVNAGVRGAAAATDTGPAGAELAPDTDAASRLPTAETSGATAAASALDDGPATRSPAAATASDDRDATETLSDEPTTATTASATTDGSVEAAPAFDTHKADTHGEATPADGPPPAAGTHADADRAPGTGGHAGSAPAGGWLSGWNISGLADTDTGPRQAAEIHVVVPGDTLWDIAAEQLPPEQRTNAAIAEQWQRIHAANQDVIGEDPDLILPGMRLILPPPSN